MSGWRFKVCGLWLILAVCAFSLFSFPGCALLQKKTKAPQGSVLLQPQAILKFSDVPVPVGFKLLAQNSFAFESAGVRTCVLRYRGKATPEQVISFYKEQMPMYNWDLLNIIEYGDRLMNFDRQNETCLITLLGKGNSVTITISLGPKPQISTKASRPAK